MEILYISRYDDSHPVRQKSGYERIVDHYSGYKRIKNIYFISYFIYKLRDYFNVRLACEGYFWLHSAKDVVAIIKGVLTQTPIHVLYGDKDACLLMYLKTKFPSIPIKVFGTLHWPLDVFENVDKKIELYKAFDKVIVMGSLFYKELRKRGIEKISLIHHGIDLSFWNRELVRENSKWGKRYGLILGGSNRDHSLQIAYMKYLISKHDVTFFVKTPIESIANLYRDIEGVTVIDEFLDDVDLRDLIGNARFLLIIQEQCVASNSVLEAMALGVPILTNDVGDVKDYLGCEYPYFITKEDCQQKLNDFCRIQDFELQNLSAYLSNRVVRFSWPKIVDKTIDFFKD